jgi:hypothetical protein
VEDRGRFSVDVPTFQWSPIVARHEANGQLSEPYLVDTHLIYVHGRNPCTELNSVKVRGGGLMACDEIRDRIVNKTTRKEYERKERAKSRQGSDLPSGGTCSELLLPCLSGTLAPSPVRHG